MTATSGPGFPVHPPEPLPDTAVTIGGPRHLRPFDERLARAYPAEGLCKCGQMVERASQDGPWVHAGRMPGED